MSNIVNELELSVRTSNTLKRMGDVDTMDDFMALTEGRVRAVRGAGRRTWNEIKEVQAHFRQVEKRRAAQPVGEDWTKRDEIALMILPTVANIFITYTPPHGMTPEQMLAKGAYSIADAMLAARETKEDNL